MNKNKIVICYFSPSSGDWGGSSRVLFTNLKFLDREKFEPIVLIPEEGPIISLFEQSNIHYFIWGQLYEPKSLLKYIIHIFKSIQLFHKNNVDIFHISNCNYWRPAEILAARLLRIPVISHYHVVIKKPEPAPFVKLSKLLIANSEFTAKTSETDNVPIDVVYPIVDSGRFENGKDIRQELNISNDTIVISFIGQIRKIKGVEHFIELAKKITDKRVQLLIVGSCRDPKQIGDTYTEQGLNNAIEGTNIHYVGYRSDVENLYKTSDIIVMPSLWDEPFGLINIEAGAASKPIVASRVGGIPEIIEHGNNGFLFDRDDIDSLVLYTKKLIEDKNLRIEMGKRARQVVRKKFTGKPIRKMEALYESLLNTRH